MNKISNYFSSTVFRFIYAKSAQSTINICIEAHFHAGNCQRSSSAPAITFKLYEFSIWICVQFMRHISSSRSSTLEKIYSVVKLFSSSSCHDWEINAMLECCKCTGMMTVMTINSSEPASTIEWSIEIADFLFCARCWLVSSFCSNYAAESAQKNMQRTLGKIGSIITFQI